jgi:hypothetical protein
LAAKGAPTMVMSPLPSTFSPGLVVVVAKVTVPVFPLTAMVPGLKVLDPPGVVLPVVADVCVMVPWAEAVIGTTTMTATKTRDARPSAATALAEFPLNRMCET